MNAKRLFLTSAAAVSVVGLSTRCTTTYDAYGRPVQSVDPGVAIAGVAAAGVLGYAIANNNDDDHHHRHHRRHHHRHGSGHHHHY